MAGCTLLRMGLVACMGVAVRAETIRNSIGMAMVEVSVDDHVDWSREFLNGVPPQFRQVLARGRCVVRGYSYYLSETEVSLGQWRKVMGDASIPKDGEAFARAELPAVFVTHADARSFCEKLSAMEGASYRLPRYDEWLFACRAGEPMALDRYKREAVAGILISPDAIADGALVAARASGRWTAHSSNVFLPNAFGLRGMIGGVDEWCSDTCKFRYPSGVVREMALAMGAHLTQYNPTPTLRDSPGFGHAGPPYAVSNHRSVAVGFRVLREVTPESPLPRPVTVERDSGDMLLRREEPDPVLRAHGELPQLRGVVDYTVQPGQAIGDLLSEFGVGIDVVQRFNPGIDLKRIAAGDVVRIPLLH